MTAPFGYEVREAEKRKEQEQSFKGYKKKYVTVDCTITADGKLIPNIIHFDSIHKYEVDKVLEMKRAASLRCGGNEFVIKLGFLIRKHISFLMIWNLSGS